MKNKAISYPYVGWMGLFVVAPILIITLYAFTTDDGGFTLSNFQDMAQYTSAFGRSFLLAAIATVVCLLIGYPLAYLLARESGWLHRMANMLIMLPMWMNFLLRIYAWVTLLQDNGPIDMMLSLLGIHSTYIGNTGAVILGMVYEYLPFMVLPIYTVMSKIDNGLIEAAQDLGSNNFTVFRKVVAPLSIPGIISGVTMVFVPSASTFLVAQYLGGPDDIMIGDVIEKIFWTDQNTGSAISLILMIFIFVFLIIMNLFGDEEAIA